jgi:hypothetical protein
LPKFNTNLCIGDMVIINEGIGMIINIKGTELTLTDNNLRWTIYITDIQTFERVA